MIRACVRSKIVKSVSLLKPESFQIFYLRISNNPHIGKYHLSTWWLKLLYKTCWPNLYVFKQVCFLTCYPTPMPPPCPILPLSLSLFLVWIFCPFYSISENWTISVPVCLPIFVSEAIFQFCQLKKWPCGIDDQRDRKSLRSVSVCVPVWPVKSCQMSKKVAQK